MSNDLFFLFFTLFFYFFWQNFWSYFGETIFSFVFFLPPYNFLKKLMIELCFSVFSSFTNLWIYFQEGYSQAHKFIFTTLLEVCQPWTKCHVHMGVHSKESTVFILNLLGSMNFAWVRNWTKMFAFGGTRKFGLSDLGDNTDRWITTQIALTALQIYQWALWDQSLLCVEPSTCTGKFNTTQSFYTWQQPRPTRAFFSSAGTKFGQTLTSLFGNDWVQKCVRHLCHPLQILCVPGVELLYSFSLDHTALNAIVMEFEVWTNPANFCSICTL